MSKKEKRRLTRIILKRVKRESLYAESSGYMYETLRRVLKDEL